MSGAKMAEEQAEEKESGSLEVQCCDGMGGPGMTGRRGMHGEGVNTIHRSPVLAHRECLLRV
jgi:hypothetical protein